MTKLRKIAKPKGNAQEANEAWLSVYAPKARKPGDMLRKNHIKDS